MHGVWQGGQGDAATKVALVRTVLGGPPVYLGEVAPSSKSSTAEPRSSLIWQPNTWNFESRTRRCGALPRTPGYETTWWAWPDRRRRPPAGGQNNWRSVVSPATETQAL
jgi:hypothetical protein